MQTQVTIGVCELLANLVAISSRCWQVWRVLTDYERLAEFVPNLERCVRLPRGPNGRVRLRQARFSWTPAAAAAAFAAAPDAIDALDLAWFLRLPL